MEVKRNEEQRSQTTAGKLDPRQRDLLRVGDAFGSGRPKLSNQLEARAVGRFENEEWKPLGKVWLPKRKRLRVKKKKKKKTQQTTVPQRNPAMVRITGQLGLQAEGDIWATTWKVSGTPGL